MIPFENVKIIKMPDLNGGVSSTVTLIKGEKNVVVDSGGFADAEVIKKSLNKEGLTPEQIDFVIATHYHWDHVSNFHIFKNARLYKCYSFSSYIDIKNNKTALANIQDGFRIIDDIELILTPGHVEHHMSVVVNTDKGKVVIAGDAIGHKEWVDLTKLPDKRYVWDEKKYTESRKKILKIADYVIPGHSDMFKVEK
jgi:glyoxylase-like metal-dependent hydrolase (beta-lactamase superfamily II)